jgi:hypothetical protein
VQWRQEYAVEQVALNPKYDVAFFRDVPFPGGTAVYEIENGKILRSYRQGAPDAPGGLASTSGFRRWWLLWANFALVVVVGGFLVGRKVFLKSR